MGSSAMLLVTVGVLCAGCSESTAPRLVRGDLHIVVPRLSTRTLTTPEGKHGAVRVQDVPSEYQVAAGSSDAYNNAWFDNGAHGLSSGHFTGTDASVQTHATLWFDNGQTTSSLGSQDGAADGFSQIVPKIGAALSSSTIIPTSNNCGLTLNDHGDFYAAVKYLGQIISGGPIPVPAVTQSNGACPTQTGYQGGGGGSGSGYTTCFVLYTYDLDTGEIYSFTVLSCV